MIKCTEFTRQNLFKIIHAKERDFLKNLGDYDSLTQVGRHRLLKMILGKVDYYNNITKVFSEKRWAQDKCNPTKKQIASYVVYIISICFHLIEFWDISDEDLTETYNIMNEERG